MNSQNPSAITQEDLTPYQDSISYLGESSDVRPFIAKSYCVVLPSYKEGIPRTLLEAMSMQKPIITTNVSGCKECIQPPFSHQDHLIIGQNGILIPPKNPNALTQAISYLSNLSQEKYLEMANASREYAKNRFDITHTLSMYLQALQRNGIKNKILAFISNSCFGMYNFRLPILQALQKNGYQIHIIAPKDDRFFYLLQKEDFILHSLSIDSKGTNPRSDFQTYLSIKQILKTIQPDLVFNYTIKPVIYGSLACNQLKIPNIAITTGLGYVFIEGNLKKKILKNFVCMLYKIALKKTNEVWFLNQDDQMEFLKNKIITSSQAKILDGEGVDTQFFAPQDNPPPPLSQTFILIARMLKDKGVFEFIQASRNFNQ